MHESFSVSQFQNSCYHISLPEIKILFKLENIFVLFTWDSIICTDILFGYTLLPSTLKEVEKLRKSSIPDFKEPMVHSAIFIMR